MRRLVLAAERGDADAQFNLGMICDNNLDDNHNPGGGDHTQAIAWLLKAARQGLPHAQSKLAELYADGPDRPKRDVPACAWFTLAANNSVGARRDRAQSGYKRVASRMTPAQIAQAARLVRNWAPKPETQRT
jgi:TPR repeat protein